MNEEIKNIIEATSMGKLEKEAVIKSLLDLHSVSKCTICDKEYTKEHNMDRMCQSCCTKAYYDK